MDKSKEKALKEELSQHFTGSPQRLTVLSKLILAVLQMSSINYSKLLKQAKLTSPKTPII